MQTILTGDDSLRWTGSVRGSVAERDAGETLPSRRHEPCPDSSALPASLMFTRRCSLAGIEVSNGSRGDCFDNAAMESFHASLKKDLIHRRSWPTKAEARTAVFEYIEAFYNRRRRHSRLGMLSPVETPAPARSVNIWPARPHGRS